MDERYLCDVHQHREKNNMNPQKRRHFRDGPEESTELKGLGITIENNTSSFFSTATIDHDDFDIANASLVADSDNSEMPDFLSSSSSEDDAFYQDITFDDIISIEARTRLTDPSLISNAFSDQIEESNGNGVTRADSALAEEPAEPSPRPLLHMPGVGRYAKPRARQSSLPVLVKDKIDPSSITGLSEAAIIYYQSLDLQPAQLARAIANEIYHEDLMARGFKLSEAYITDAEMKLYETPKYSTFRTLYPSPLRNCWTAPASYIDDGDDCGDVVVGEDARSNGWAAVCKDPDDDSDTATISTSERSPLHKKARS